MMLLRNQLDKVEPIKCPTRNCKGTLPLGLLTKECSICGQIFILPLLFPEAHKQVKQKQKQKEDTVEPQ